MTVPKESVEQEQLANWLDMNWYKFSAIRNESDTRSFYKWKQRKLSGCRKWIPDFCILLKRKAVLFIELKRQRPELKNWKKWKSPSVVSPEQIEWNTAINEIDNVSACISYWYKEAIQHIQEHEQL